MGRFFIDSIPTDAEFCTFTDFECPSEEIMFLDTRLNNSDLECLTPNSHYTNMFEVKDEIKGRRNAEVLLSLCLYHLEFSKNARGRPFEVYLNGLKQWIDYMESDEGKHEMLRVYVADDCWDLLQKEGIFKHKDFDFVRMQLSSKHSYLGTLWRYLAFDDYNYEYVYIEETDGHNYLGDDGRWHLRFEIGGYGVPRFRRLPKNYHFYTSILEPPLQAKSGIIPPREIVGLSTHIRLVTPHLTRCGCKLPVDMQTLLAWDWSMPEELVAYMPSQNVWTRFPLLLHVRRGYDGYFNFPISKITRSYLRLLLDLDTLRDLYLRHGDNWYYKRMFDDLRADGNTIVAYDEDDKGYPFE